MYDIQFSERGIVIEKPKHLGLIGVFVQQNNSQTNAPRVHASGIHSFIHSYSFNYKKKKKRNGKGSLTTWRRYLEMVYTGYQRHSGSLTRHHQCLYLSVLKYQRHSGSLARHHQCLYQRHSGSLARHHQWLYQSVLKYLQELCVPVTSSVSRRQRAQLLAVICTSLQLVLLLMTLVALLCLLKLWNSLLTTLDTDVVWFSLRKRFVTWGCYSTLYINTRYIHDI